MPLLITGANQQPFFAVLSVQPPHDPHVAPYELANLAYLDSFNDKRAELQAELAQWLERTGDSFTLPAL